MNLLLIVVFSSLFAGLAMPLGAAIASVEKIGPNWIEEEFRHSVIAFGGGALLSAVALVLVPEGIAHLSPWSVALMFISGGVAFLLLDVILKKIDTEASQLAAMLSDFIPESIALGAAFATGSSTAYLLAGLIALQNLPEGFNAFRELNESSSYSRCQIIIVFVFMSFLGPASALTGYLWLKDCQEMVAAIMLFASGGIVYSIFQDIAPQVKLEKHYAPPMGAILGFVLGMLGFMFVT